MSDISLIWDPAISAADIAFTQGDVETGNDLATAVLLSLFTDRLANVDDVLPHDDGNRRGWWGDRPETPNGKVGSRLWLIERAKETQATLQAAFDYETEALQWLIDDGVASEIDVHVEWTRPRLLGSRITVTKPDGQRVTVAYDWAWEQLFG